MEIFLLGANYKTCPLGLREQLSFPEEHIQEALSRLSQVGDEAVVLSTCHRLEVYVLFDQQPLDAEAVVRLVSGWSRLDRETLLSRSYILTGEDAIRHLFDVAAGMDSAVVGEFQVLGQVRLAINEAVARHAARRILPALFRRAVAAGRRVRQETALGRHDASLSQAAVEHALSNLHGLSSKRALIIGAGKMGTLAAEELRRRDISGIEVVSRTLLRARLLAERVDGTALSFDDLEAALARCDLAVSSTSAPHAVVHRPTVERAMSGRTRPLLIIDLALPRDVDTDVGSVPGVTLLNVDDLGEVGRRLSEAVARDLPKARGLVEASVQEFLAWLREQEAIPTVAALYRRAEAIRRRELAHSGIHLSELTPEEQYSLNAATRAMLKKLLHPSIALLKESARCGNGVIYRQTVRELFGLDAVGSRENAIQAR